MIFIDFTQTGGYPLKQGTLLKMQSAYYQVLTALIAQLGISDEGKYILKGCDVVGANIESGIMYIDGQLCTFDGAPGDLTSKIIKVEIATNLPFKNGTNLPVVKNRKAVVDATGTLLSDFITQPIVIDADYVHTDNNFTAELLTKLNGIETAAEVNVQADWAQTDSTQKDYIKNKVVFAEILHAGLQILGEFPIGPDESRMISFPDVGTDDYYVVPVLVSNGSFNNDNDVIITTKNYTNTSFNLLGSSAPDFLQDLTLKYLIIKNPS